MEKQYDLVIIGCGPAGMSAAIYAKRAGIKVLILEKLVPGGQISLTSNVENFPGFSQIDGMQLGNLMFEQVKKLGVDVKFCEVTKLELLGKTKKITTPKEIFTSKSVVLAMGASPRQLGVLDEQKFVGRGISYCAVCDGALYKNKTVAVFGGGNSALEDVSYLCSVAKQVIHVNRRSEFRADNQNVEIYNKLVSQKPSKVKQYLGFVAEKLYGDKVLESVDLRNITTNEIINIKPDGVFVAIGRVPQTQILENQVNLDENGYVLVDENMQTNVKGVFAAGDITKKTLRQITTAVGDGSVAGTYASDYVKKLKVGK